MRDEPKCRACDRSAGHGEDLEHCWHTREVDPASEREPITLHQTRGLPPSWRREWDDSPSNPGSLRGRASNLLADLATSTSVQHGCATLHHRDGRDPAFDEASSLTQTGDDNSVPIISKRANIIRGTDEELTRRAAEIWPDRTRYEFLGLLRPKGDHIWIHAQPGAQGVSELLRARGVVRPGEYSQDGDRGILVSADGRCFIEQDWVWRRRLGAARIQSPRSFRATKSYNRPIRPPLEQVCGASRRVESQPKAAAPAILGAGSTTAGVAMGVNDLLAPIQPKSDEFFGDDSRTLVTSIGYPSSAVAVALMAPGGISFAGIAGSASMIGPRHVLTVCHTFTEDGEQHEVRGVAPARRGSSWSDEPVPIEGDGNSKFPHGVRRVQWYYWPNGWDGSGTRYDYGVLILWDQPFMPGYILCGTRPIEDLDYNNANMVGYPGGEKTCKFSPDDDGECGGYAYFEYGETASGYTNHIYHKLDVQEGQSGAPLYWYDDGVRRVFMMHKATYAASAYAKRIRGGNFDSICEWIGNWPSETYDDPEC